MGRSTECPRKQLRTNLFPGRSTERPYTLAGVGKNLAAGDILAVRTLHEASDKNNRRPPDFPNTPRSVPAD
ncbi:hypothetical protein ED551_05800 [Muribaculaceae bacterium Isolate-013 (NCI)]|nr:hypothetical protein ED551_05800 [Muribaculaceae bacterium Isolate-013 (NCI)]